MKHRPLGAVLFGVGVLLLVFAAGLAFVVTPSLKKLPYDLKPTESVAEAPGARFLQIRSGGDLRIEQATLRATTKVQTNKKETADLTGNLDSTAVVWLVGQTVLRTDTNDKISQYSAQLAVDRVSGAGLPSWEGRWYDESESKEKVDFVGQVYKFPFDTEKKDYPVYDRDLRKAFPAQYKGTETIEGIEAYRFEQVISNQELALPADRVKLLLGTFSPDASSGNVVYSNTRTVWVDPVTGSYLKVREAQRKFLVPNSGLQTTLLNANFEYTEASVKEAAKRAKESRLQLQAIGVYIPASLAILGLLAALAGLLVVRRHAVAADDEAGDRAEDVPAEAAAPADQPAVRRDERDTAEQPTVADRPDGPLTDKIPPPTTNWQADGEPAVPDQRAAVDEAEKR